MKELFCRAAVGPLLTASDWPYPVNTVFNRGAALVDGQTVLLCRVEDRNGASHPTVARSSDGIRAARLNVPGAIAYE